LATPTSSNPEEHRAPRHNWYEDRAHALGVILKEKQRRELEFPRRQTVPLLPSTGSSSAMLVVEPPSGSTAVPSTANGVSLRSHENDLLGLRSVIEDLRRIMLNVHMERPEPSSDLGAPPDYS